MCIYIYIFMCIYIYIYIYIVFAMCYLVLVGDCTIHVFIDRDQAPQNVPAQAKEGCPYQRLFAVVCIPAMCNCPLCAHIDICVHCQHHTYTSIPSVYPIVSLGAVH